MATRSAATATRPQISARLPVSDWQIRWRRQPDGRTVLEITGHACTLTGALTVTFTDRASRTTIHQATVDGLRVAAVTRHYTAARCHPGRQVHEICHLLTTNRASQPPVTRRHQPLKVAGTPH